MTTDDDNWRCVNCGEPEGEDGQLPCGHPFGLFRLSDPDNWKLPGIARLSTIPSADEPMLTDEETDELVARINANPLLQPLPSAGKLRGGEFPETAQVGCILDPINNTYVRLFFTPKNGETTAYRVSRGGAEVLAAEINAALSIQTISGKGMREALEELLAAVNRTPKHLRMPAEVEAAAKAEAVLAGLKS